MFTGATRTVLFNLHIARQGEPEELESRVSETLDRLHGLGCEGVVEDLIRRLSHVGFTALRLRSSQ